MNSASVQENVQMEFRDDKKKMAQEVVVLAITACHRVGDDWTPGFLLFSPMATLQAAVGAVCCYSMQ